MGNQHLMGPTGWLQLYIYKKKYHGSQILLCSTEERNSYWFGATDEPDSLTTRSQRVPSSEVNHISTNLASSLYLVSNWATETLRLSPSLAFIQVLFSNSFPVSSVSQSYPLCGLFSRYLPSSTLLYLCHHDQLNVHDLPSIKG